VGTGSVLLPLIKLIILIFLIRNPEKVEPVHQYQSISDDENEAFGPPLGMVPYLQFTGILILFLLFPVSFFYFFYLPGADESELKVRIFASGLFADFIEP